MTSQGDDRIRVLHLLHGLGLGGAERIVYNLARELGPLGCVPVICAWRRRGPLEPSFRAAGLEVEVAAVEPTGWARARVAGVLYRLVMRHRIDVIHAHMSDSAFWGVVMQRLTGRPCVITHHSTDLIDGVQRRRWARRRLLRACVRRAAANVAVSAAVRMQLAAETGLVAGSVLVLPGSTTPPSESAVEASCAARNARAAAGFGADGQPTIVYAGRMNSVKGPETLVDAAPYVLRAFPRAAFVLVGAGVMLEELRQRVHALGLDTHFQFPGAVTDVAPFLSNADLYVSASRQEGLSMALIEAMSWGLPVVASDVDGHRELVRPGETGVLVPPGEPALLGAAIVAALRDWQATQARARQAREVVHQGYRSEEIARRYVELYRRVLGQRVR